MCSVFTNKPIFRILIISIVTTVAILGLLELGLSFVSSDPQSKEDRLSKLEMSYLQDSKGICYSIIESSSAKGGYKVYSHTVIPCSAIKE